MVFYFYALFIIIYTSAYIVLKYSYLQKSEPKQTVWLLNIIAKSIV